MGLYESIAKKRAQRKRDYGQDEEIKKLKEQVEKTEKREREREQEDRKDHRRASPPRSGDRDDFADSLDRSGAMIQRQYEQGYERLGRRFAVGDSTSYCP